jgi:hypothetical protein
MAPIGFRKYSDRDRYAGRRVANKAMNLAWKVSVTVLVVVCLVYVVKFLWPWQQEVNSAINHPAKYEGVPSFWR